MKPSKQVAWNKRPLASHSPTRTVGAQTRQLTYKKTRSMVNGEGVTQTISTHQPRVGINHECSLIHQNPMKKRCRKAFMTCPIMIIEQPRIDC